MNFLMLLSQHALTGAEVYAVTVSEELMKRGHQGYIISDTLTTPTTVPYETAPVTRKSVLARLRLVRDLVRFVDCHRIQVIHSHSRASRWIADMVSRRSGIPHISTVHGRQHLHLSRHLYPAFGDHVLAVCETIKSHLENDLHVRPEKIEILRNPIRLNPSRTIGRSTDAAPMIALIGRLDGPKGDVAYELLERLINGETTTAGIIVIGGAATPERFRRFQDRVRFVGQVTDLSEWILKSGVIIGAGRVAMEAIMYGKPVIAVGEACSLGLVTTANLAEAMATNFGDVSNSGTFDWDRLLADVKIAESRSPSDPALTEAVRSDYACNPIVDRIEALYQHSFVHKRRYEMPVLCYHRVVKDPDTKCKHGTWITAKQFEQHLAYLKRENFHPITFSQLRSVNRLDTRERYVMITFDDGYADNYEVALPLLQKYGFRAVIFLVAGRSQNDWDLVPDQDQPPLPLLDEARIREMSALGIEFGSHTMTHPDLTHFEEEDIRRELRDSKAKLEAILGKPVEAVAYPYGACNDTVKRLALEAGYGYGVTGDDGPIAVQDDYLAIRRIVIFPGTTTYRFARKVRGDYGFRQLKRQQKRRSKSAQTTVGYSTS